METIDALLRTREDQVESAFDVGLSRKKLEQLTPAVYAKVPHEKMSSRYAFVPTADVAETMDRAGFVVVAASQSRARRRSPAFAAHALRFRKRRTEVFVGEVVPEILVLNSHDGSSAYHVRIALFRAICRNGMIVSDAAFPSWKVPHRGSAPTEVLEAALALAQRFSEVGAVVQRMQEVLLDQSQRLAFASDALRIRYPDEPAGLAVAPADILRPKRSEDEGDDVWRVFNTVQENIIKGGAPRRTPTNRLVRMRGVRAIREDVRLNTGLWERAMREIV